MAINYVEQYSQSKEDNLTPHFEPQDKDFVVPVLEGYAEELHNKIEDALKQSNHSFTEVKEQYQQPDFSEVANDIWKALNEMDDSTVAQLINATIYGATDMAVDIAAAVYDKVSERFGETLTTAINDLGSFNDLVEPFMENIQSDMDEGKFDEYWHKTPDTPYPEPSDLEFKEAVPLGEALSNLDYLRALPASETVNQNEHSKQSIEIER